MASEIKTCPSCGKEKYLTDFHIDRSSKTGRTSSCKACAKERSKRFYQTSETYRQSIREGGLKNRFGITQNDYFQMFEDQNELCGICKQKVDGYLHVDHDHSNGVIRGLLCKNCNHGLGNFKDNINLLKNAIEYLDKNSVSKF